MTNEELLTAVRKLLAARSISAKTSIEGNEIVIQLGAKIDDDELVSALHKLDSDKQANFWIAPTRISPCFAQYRGGR